MNTAAVSTAGAPLAESTTAASSVPHVGPNEALAVVTAVTAIGTSPLAMRGTGRTRFDEFFTAAGFFFGVAAATPSAAGGLVVATPSAAGGLVVATPSSAGGLVVATPS